jgi:hypothetical protein
MIVGVGVDAVVMGRGRLAAAAWWGPITKARVLRGGSRLAGTYCSWSLSPHVILMFQLLG